MIGETVEAVGAEDAATYFQAAPPDQIWWGLQPLLGTRGSMTGTIEIPKVGGPGSGLDDNWRVIVLNDDHNTFDGVASALARVVPGVTLEQGYRFADKIHNTRPGDRLGRARRSRPSSTGSS